MASSTWRPALATTDVVKQQGQGRDVNRYEDPDEHARGATRSERSVAAGAPLTTDSCRTLLDELRWYTARTRDRAQTLLDYYTRRSSPSSPLFHASDGPKLTEEFLPNSRPSRPYGIAVATTSCTAALKESMGRP